ncbi:MAG: ABC transporter permease [Acidobacteria bacterium]|nr:ABC transporter permease [Acidobacteriota bacterium]
MLQLFREIKNNHELIWALAIKELRVRYKNSALGFLWALLHPLLMMAVYIIVFSTILGRGMDNYGVFLISGIFPWSFFSQSTNYSVSTIVGNSTLLKKVYVDKSVFPVSAVLSNLVNFALSLIALVVILIAMRFPLHWTWVYFPVPVVFLCMFALGFGFLCSAANVFFRDVSHIIQIIMSAWFFMSGVIFPLDVIDPKYQIILKLNPMLYIIDLFHQAVYYGVPLNLNYAILSFVCSLAVLILGYAIFRRLQDMFVYYL